LFEVRSLLISDGGNAQALEKLNSVLAEFQDVKITVSARQEEPEVLEIESLQDAGESPVNFLDNDDMVPEY